MERFCTKPNDMGSYWIALRPGVCMSAKSFGRRARASDGRDSSIDWAKKTHLRTRIFYIAQSHLAGPHSFPSTHTHTFRLSIVITPRLRLFSRETCFGRLTPEYLGHLRLGIALAGPHTPAGIRLPRTLPSFTPKRH